jgi:hypothetical protein
MAKTGKGVSSIREAECKAVASKELKDLLVAAPDEIDLVTIAWRNGRRLRIEEGGLEYAEGRLVVASEGGGSIRVKQGMNLGRKRFTIAHEIGHYLLHPRKGVERNDTAENFTIWKDQGEELEANIFAAELLLPQFLVKEHCRNRMPSLALVDRIAQDFSTSVMAAAFQYVSYTNEQVALVISQGSHIKSFHKAKDFWPRMRNGNLHPHSGAAERVSGKSGDTGKMVRTPVYAWLADFENDERHDIMEDSRYLDWYDRTITLLWMKDELED